MDEFCQCYPCFFTTKTIYYPGHLHNYNIMKALVVGSGAIGVLNQNVAVLY